MAWLDHQLYAVAFCLHGILPLEVPSVMPAQMADFSKIMNDNVKLTYSADICEQTSAVLLK